MHTKIVLISNKVFHVVFLNEPSILNKVYHLFFLNKTQIALIPVLMFPNDLIEFHPISLCNIILKVISKIIDNRLKTMPLT